jgi:ABC-2 type transport system ATP-binding protein
MELYTMIKVENLSRAYGDFQAVDSVSFDIAAGEIVGLLGHNGAGKTTIMKMLSGYLEPSGGSVHIDGKELGENTRAVQEILGYLPENPPLYPDMSVADYLDFAANLKGLQGQALRDSMRRVIRDTELKAKLLEPISTLSRGYKQRLGVAQAILGEPKILILDEPTNGLDPNQTQHMRELIRALSSNATVILSTHIMQEVDAICDRALILRDGHIALDENLSDLRDSGHLQLRTNLGVEQALAALKAVSMLERVTPLDSGDGKFNYHIALPPGADADTAAAMVAVAIADVHGRLYQLTPEIRDLESVFRDVNLREEASYAA